MKTQIIQLETNSIINYLNLKTMTTSVIKLMVLTAVLVLISNIGIAQKSDSLTRKAQLTFIFPLGTNGINSMDYTNNFSFNYLVGLNGGVNGAELGGIANYNTGDVTGFQAAGMFNVNQKQSKGLILSGIANIGLDSSQGAFISGIFNYSKHKFTGTQISNVNIATDEMKGLQVGVFNYAKDISGVQFGLINISNKVTKGTPIGLISIVKNGHFELEATAGDLLYANINYKMGIEHFYNIFKLGYGYQNGKSITSVGYGFGSTLTFAEKHKMSIDLSTSALVYSDDYKEIRRNDVDWLSKLDLNYRYSITPKLSVIGGPSFNMLVNDKSNGSELNGENNSVEAPYTMWTKKGDSRDLSSWIGFNAGLAYKF